MRSARALAAGLVVAALAACAPAPELGGRGPGGEGAAALPDTEADVPEPGTGALTTSVRPAYWRWPRRSDSEPDERFPDSPLFGPDERPPVLHGEEIDYPTEPVLIVASHNLRGQGHRKAGQTVSTAGGLAPVVPERTVGAFLAALHLEMDPDVLALQEVVGNSETQRIRFAELDGDDVEWRERRVRSADYMAILTQALAPRLALARGTEAYTRRIGTYFEYCPIFYNVETLECSQGGVSRRDSFGGDSRGVSYTRCQLRDAAGLVKDELEFDFAIACVHAPPPGASRDDRANYQAGLVQLARWMARQRDPDVIIAGDFNVDFRKAASDNAVRDITEGLRDYEQRVVDEAEAADMLDGLPDDRKRPSTSVDYANGRDAAGNPVGTNINEANPQVYDDILWFAPSFEDAVGVKYIETGFDAAFRRPDGSVDRTAQHRFSDHKPVWTMFYAGRDNSDKAGDTE